MAMGKIEVTVPGMGEFTEALRDTRALLLEVEQLAGLRPEVRDAVVLNTQSVRTRLAGRLIEVCAEHLSPEVIEVEVEVECEHDDCSCQCDCCDNCKWCS